MGVVSLIFSYLTCCVAVRGTSHHPLDPLSHAVRVAAVPGAACPQRGGEHPRSRLAGFGELELRLGPRGGRYFQESKPDQLKNSITTESEMRDASRSPPST